MDRMKPTLPEARKGHEVHPENPVLAYLHDIRFELQILNLQTMYGVETDELILGILERVFATPAVPATGFKISQIIGGNMQSDITGIVKGAKGQFASTLDPAGSAGQAGLVPAWSVDDPL